MFHHNTCPQAEEGPDEDSQFSEWMDLLEADEREAQHYTVPVGGDMPVAW